MDNNKTQEEEVELFLPKYDEDTVSKGLGDEILDRFPATIDRITNWFKQYQIDSVELSISGVMETGGITRLIVSAKGEAGIKVVLKPKA